MYSSAPIALVKKIVASTARAEFLLDLLWYLRYAMGTVNSIEARRSYQHAGKAVITMCYSAYFIQATRGTCVQRQLLQCRTCGSQAFHVLDCCRNPDYARVPTSLLGERLKAWLEAVQARMRAALFPPRQRPAEPVSPAVLDAWEARPLTLSNAEDTRVLRETGADKVVDEIEHETLSA
jgi:hypothetical protein